MDDKTSPAPIIPAGVDYEALGRNIARMIEEGGRALAAYMKPRQEGKVQPDSAAEWTDLVKTLGQVMEYWLPHSPRTVELQSTLGKSYLDLWAAGAKRLSGQTTEPVIKPDPRDRRFTDPEW